MDDMLPAFLLCLIQLGPSHLRSELEFVKAYRVSQLEAVGAMLGHATPTPVPHSRAVQSAHLGTCLAWAGTVS